MQLIKFDEILLIPHGWSTAPAFDVHTALSFGSSNACAKSPFDDASCSRVWKGHRKYAIRTQKTEPLNRLLPPQYIHGHPAEFMIPKSSGVFIAHLSRCSISNISDLVFLPHEASLGALKTIGSCPPERDKEGALVPWIYN